MISAFLPGVAPRRILAGISQRELAKRIGVSYQTVRRIEQGRSAGRIPFSVICAIAQVLDATVDELHSVALANVTPAHSHEELSYPEARLLFQLGSSPTTCRSLSHQDRTITLPKLLAKGHVVVVDGQPRASPAVLDTLK
jgi:transcriptional regulator with XRE-family HTH domain